MGVGFGLQRLKQLSVIGIDMETATMLITGPQTTYQGSFISVRSSNDPRRS